MTANGYIKLWRQIRQSPVWVDDGALKLWIDLLMRVTTKPRKTVLKIGREPVVVELEAGQCAVRERLLAQDLRMSRNKLRRRMALLVRLECITLAPTTKYILVTIPKWAKYQQRHPKGGAKIEPPFPNGGSAIEPGSEPPSEPPSEPHNKKTKKTKKIVGDDPPKQVWDGDAWPLSNGSLYRLPLDVYERYLITYSFDIDADLRKCAQWCRDNKPERSKTAAGQQRRITAWLNRSDDRYRKPPRQAPPASHDTPSLLGKKISEPT